MNRWILPIAAGVLILMGTGCATVRGDKQNVKFVTDPPGASLTLDGKDKLTTPAQVTLLRKSEHKVEIAKAGYRPIVFVLKPQWDGASLVDAALPGGSALFSLAVVSGSDKSFGHLATIKLEKTTAPDPAPLELYPYRGKLYTASEYEQAVDKAAKEGFGME